jgi:hypothetical protein
MHYHVLLIDDQGEHCDSASTFATQHEAERQAATVAREIDGPGWSGKRYPGRVWRRHEVAVYLDRRPLERGIPRLELAIVRCPRANHAHVPGCYLHDRGLEW